MRILVVEDEKHLSKSITTYLTQGNFNCEAVYDFTDGKHKIEQGTYDCIVLDITLPDGNGMDLLKHIKNKRVDSGVLIISAKNSINDKVNALELGSDDYLTKPFHLAELTARINSIIRRRHFEGNNVIECDKLIIDMLSKTVKVGIQPLNLTRKEYDLLLYFISNKERIVTKESIADHLWENQTSISYGYDFIYSHIKNLRKKLLDKGCPDYIKAMYGMGYKFIVDARS